MPHAGAPGGGPRPSADPGERPFEVALEQAELFRALGPDALARIQPHLRERAFYRQRILFREGDPAASLWVVRRGVVRIYHVSADGRPTTLESHGPGEIFGALSALDGERYPVSAEALEEGFAWCLPRDVLQRMLDEDSRVGIEMLRIVASRLRSAHLQLHSFAHDPRACTARPRPAPPGARGRGLRDAAPARRSCGNHRRDRDPRPAAPRARGARAERGRSHRGARRGIPAASRRPVVIAWPAWPRALA